MTQSSVDTAPAIHHLITEDDTPVDNLPSEKQQRLLTEPLYSVWAGPGDGRPFLAAANVGVFYQARNPAIVPDMFLSLDVQVADDWWQKEHRSYFLWEFGKPPELVLEIVSNREGGEDDNKKRIYERMHVNYYVIYDPLQQIMADVLTVYRRHDTGYTRMELPLFPLLKLGLTLWEGTFEDKHDTWLRWTDEHGRLIPTGKERADQAEARAAQAALQVQQATLQAEQATLQAEQATLQAEQATLQAEQANASAVQERQRAEQATLRAEQAERRLDEAQQRAARLAELLRQAGIDLEHP